ncbi:hypothetical protein PENTCL1PPCAC_27140, partial [Pristionchus entomophagus]
KDRSISLSGYLHMKHYGSTWATLRPRRRYFYIMDEYEGQLHFFPDENAYIKDRDPVGSLPISSSAVSLSERDSRAFIVHLDDRKRVELEAESEQSCECWLKALSNRSVARDRKESSGGGGLKGDGRDRSMSLPSESDHSSGVARRKLTLPSTIEGVHSNATLSMLEEQLRKLVEKEYETTPKQRTRSVPAAPIWLDDWVSNWLHHQNFRASASNMDSSSSSTPAETGMAREEKDEDSATTSPCDEDEEDSQDCSTISSENILAEELSQLRAIVNRQKAEISRLSRENGDLNVALMEYKVRDQVSSETERNRFLNGEVLRLNQRCRETEALLDNVRSQLRTVTEERDQLKREYASALQAAIRVPVADHHSFDVLQVRLYGGDLHKRRVCLLVDEARKDNPSLPTLHSLMMGVYVDEYGFRVAFIDEGLAVHYMACRLHEHYEERLHSAMEHRQHWSDFLESNAAIPLTKESRALVRRGVPASLRSVVWKMLIHQQVIAAKMQHGKYYYRNLCSLNGGEADRLFCSTHQKQINLDLLRTMPSNVHFLNAGCKGVSQLQQVLRAFCLHNGTTGYCQGMNFLAATALLVVGPEDAFWLLVALTEGFFHESYFDESLSGAQADQEVLKELLEQKVPALTKHLEECEIDLATITLNWFIALFFDAVPFKTLLRFWDCFLLEGPKVLFRFSIALLSLHVDEILQKTDTIGVMKVVKAAVRLSFDVDGLFKLAFEDLHPFPSRAQLRAKQMTYLEILQSRFNQRASRMLIRGDSAQSDTSHQSSTTVLSDGLHICDLALASSAGRGILIAGNKKSGRLSTVDVHTGVMTQLRVEWDCRAVSVVMAGPDIAFVSFLSGYVVALSLHGQATVLWELKLADVALRLLYAEERIVACLANGSLTVIELHASPAMAPSSLELLHLPLGSAPIVDGVIYGDHVWLASACKLICLHKSTLSHLCTIYVACSGTCTGTPFFDKIVCLAASPHGVFLATTHSTLLQLWDQSSCALLFDIATDHDHKKPSLMDVDESREMHISSLLYSDADLWTGTSDGYIILYSVNAEKKEENGTYSLHKYPAGTRLSAETSPGGIKGRQGQYYIPTREETLTENDFASAQKRFTVHIDRETNQYSVVRRSPPDSSGIDDLPSTSSPDERREEKSVKRSHSNRTVRKESACSSRISRRRGLPKGLSIDSAVSSVFTSDLQPKRNGTGLASPGIHHPIVPSSSSHVSMDYDDLFEMYSEEGSRAHRARLGANCLGDGCSSLSAAEAVGENRTGGGEGLCDDCNVRSRRQRRRSSRSSSSRPRLRRKDLDDDPIVVAVKDDVNHNKREERKSESETVVCSVGLTLLMKVKISDRAVSKIVEGEINGCKIVLTCAGDYGEEEAVLKWTREKDSDLWINDPMNDPSCKRRFSRIPSVATSPPGSC